MQQTGRVPKLPFPLAIGLALLCGVGVAAQSRINGELSHRLGSGSVAALVSFGSGLVVIAVIAAVAPSARRGVVRLVRGVRTGTFPWYFLWGGLVGAVFVLSQGLSVGIIGIALFMIALVAGQTVGSTLLDRLGVGTMAPRPVTWNRVLGAALALGAVALAVSAQLRGDAVLWGLVLPFVSGLFMAWQQASNGQVREFTGSVVVATLNNFVAGTALLLVIAGIWSIWVPWPTQWPTDPLVYTGGVVGIIFIGIGALVVGTTGTLLLGLCSIAGELVASVLLDLFVPVPGHTLTVVAVAGAGIALVAVLIASIRRGTVE